MPQYKILIVDDIPLVLKALQRVFRPEGYHILTATCAEEAMKVMEGENIDMIITDENMPGLSGTDLLSLVRHKFPSVVRIMITGTDDIEVAKNAINSGEIYRFFMKPWDDFELLISVKYALEHKIAKQENDRLRSLVNKQKKLLNNLEKEHPGIADKRLTESGAIVIDP
ncbi:MAG: response regulator [candidate division Zixibacteria bacterium]|nr:response regulator [candidate division Zixibacteria bacterium]